MGYIIDCRHGVGEQAGRSCSVGKACLVGAPWALLHDRASSFSCFSERCWTKLRIIARGFCRQLLKTSVCGSSKWGRWRRFTTPWTCATSMWHRSAWLLKCGVLLLTSIPSSLLSGEALWVDAVPVSCGSTTWIHCLFCILSLWAHPLGLLESALTEDSSFSKQERWLGDKRSNKCIVWSLKFRWMLECWGFYHVWVLWCGSYPGWAL